MGKFIIGIWMAILFASPHITQAQLISDFRSFELSGVPAGEGCATYIVTFRDSSTLNGAPLPYQSVANGNAFNSHTWRFGTGASSFLQNPTFGYTNPGSYTVLLIVTDGVNVDTSSFQVTVYQNPQLDFSADVQAGCDPLAVNFTDLSTTGGLTMTSWTWDFGDGNISTLQNPAHTFNLNPVTNQNCFSITLIGTNSQGCSATRVKPNFICIDPPPTANFTVDAAVVCDSPFVVSFMDSSISINPITYFWDFGDGTTSTLEDPVHTYDSSGNYDVTLIVLDVTCGKSDTIVKPGLISANNLMVDFLISQDTFCQSQAQTFVNQTLGAKPGTSYLWDFGDGSTRGTINGVKGWADTFGLIPITLTATDPNGCSNDTVKNVYVKPTPVIDFSVSGTSSCQSPFTVNFTDLTTSGPVEWFWDFGVAGPDDTSSAQNPSFTYQGPGNYTITLIVDNDQGCSDTLVRTNLITIEPTRARFDVDTNAGCIPVTINFTDQSSSNDVIVSYSWDFDDGSPLVTTQNASHTYTTSGQYNPTLTITTQSGCVATFSVPVGAGTPPTAAFTASPLQACVDEPVSFINQSTGNPNQYNWDFGNGDVNNSQTPLPYAYDFPGTYTVELTVGNNGCEDNTTQTVVIVGPDADFNYTLDCNNSNRVTFTNTSTGGQSYQWAFGDGNTSTLEDPVHQYATSGTYNVTLTVTDNIANCVSEEVQTILITDVNVDFTSPDTVGCAPFTVRFTNLSTTGAGISYAWTFGPGQTSTLASPTITIQTPGFYNIRLSVTDTNGCVTTLTKTAFIKAYDVTPDFDANITYGCLPAPIIQFNDLSTTTNGSTLSAWQWNFGDGGTSNVQNPLYPYNTAGLFDVSLKVTNDKGCVDSLTKPDFIDINQPIADLRTGFNLYCSGQSIPFINESIGDSLDYFWNFGDPTTTADTSILQDPMYAYTDTGNYDVSLWIIDQYGCSDSITLSGLVNIQDPSISFIADDTFRFCPPHLVNFSSLIFFDTIAVRNVFWDFGDNSFSNVNTPSHIYTASGFFDVTLVVEFVNGCRDSITLVDYINIGGATGEIIISAVDGCVPHEVFLDANSAGAISHFWLFGDGGQSAGSDTITYTYQNPGIYQPSVVLTDTQAPTCSFVLTADDSIRVDTVSADFYFGADSICINEPISFYDSSGAFIDSLFVAWLWDFGDGTTDTVQNPVHSFTTSGFQTVTLTATNGIGCSGTISKSLYILDGPTAAFTLSDSVGCDTLFVSVADASTNGIDGVIVDWFWDYGDPTDTNDTFRVQNPPPHIYGDTGAYAISLTVTDNNGCIDTDTMLVNVYPIPGGVMNDDTTTICFGDSLLLSGQPGNAGYDWTPGTWLSDSTIMNPLSIPQDTITYTLVTTGPNGCTSIDLATINVIPEPTLSVSPFPDTVICLGESVQLNAVSNGISYSWAPPTGLSQTNILNPVASPTQTTTYTITVIDQNSCRNEDSVTVFVNLFTPQLSGPATCLGDTTYFQDLTITSDLPVVAWSWSFGNGDVSALQDPAYVYPDSGDYQVKLVVTDAYGCTDSIEQGIRVDIPSTPFAGFDTLICFGESVQLVGGGGDTIFWSPATEIDDPFSYTPTVTPSVTTRYVANVTNGVCPFDTAGVQVVVIPTPFVQTIDDREMIRGTQAELISQVGDVDSFYWTPPDSLDCTDCLSPIATPDSTIAYSLQVIDEYGCTNADTVMITVVERCDEDLLFVANAFTPNGDGLNDEVFARLYGLKALNYIRIFDRWGVLMFETENINEGWDATNPNGRKLNSGVFVYIAEAECFNGNTIRKSGNITLLK